MTTQSAAALAELEAMASAGKVQRAPSVSKPARSSKTKAVNEEPSFPGVQEEQPYDPADIDGEPTQTYTAEDGTKYAWNPLRGIWMPQVDEELLRQQQAIYGGTPSEAPTKGSKKRKPKAQQQPKPIDPSVPQVTQNPSDLYVEGLPTDVTEEEFANYFSKVGIIRKDGETGALKMKLYRDAEGRYKGDGLVCYLVKESVDMAINLLDGADFRPGCPLHVSVAQFVNKPDLPKKKSKKRNKKIRLIDQTKELGWDENENVHVVMKHMFEPKESWEDPNFFTELKEDITAECSKMGPVDKVVIFEHNPEGVIVLKFKNGVAAKKCIEKMNGRFFAGKKLEAEFYDGRTNYHVEESEQSKTTRLAKWEKWLEDGENKTSATT